MENNVMAAGVEKPAGIGEEEVRELVQILQRYRTGSAMTRNRIVASENWWKLRNAWEEGRDSAIMAQPGLKAVSGWLHNVIVNKHADLVEAYPEPNILPREEGDVQEAKMLTSIVPCVLEQNKFEDVYDDAAWQKCKTGTAVYKVVWDPDRLNGLGDIAISRVNLLNLYWEPGVTDIQKSRYFFHTELYDRDVLEEQYPHIKGKLKGNTLLSPEFKTDDPVDTQDKVTVAECYYRRLRQGRQVLQYCKFAGAELLYATENEPELARRGLYDHGQYPYVFDPLFPIEGSPCGYGYVDVCRSPQTTIDILNTSFLKNAAQGAMPRYFGRMDGGINEEEFLDVTKPIVHVSGNVGEDSLRKIDHAGLDSVYVNFLDRTIQELRETSGNTETSTGTAGSGVTAASAIAALQEASGKGSRDSIRGSYRCYGTIVELTIELIRQFYDLPRRFRILGQMGRPEFVSYSNAALKPQAQQGALGMDMGLRLPVFDIKVSAQKQNVYTKVSQNELAVQFFQLGFFNPQLADQAISCVQMMDFDQKDRIMQMISRNGSLMQKLTQYMPLALLTAREHGDVQLQQRIAADMRQLGMQAPQPGTAGKAPAAGTAREPGPVARARARAAEASQPGAGKAVNGNTK